MSKPQILIDADVLKLYVTGTDDDRKVLDKLYGSYLKSIHMDLFLSMIREYKNAPKSVWTFIHETKKLYLDITITVVERPMTGGKNHIQEI